MTKTKSNQPRQLGLPFSEITPAPADGPAPTPAIAPAEPAVRPCDGQASGMPAGGDGLPVKEGALVREDIEQRAHGAEQARKAVSQHEFGSLAARTPPGQDPQALADLIAGLAREIQPDNLIDRLLIHDIATGTSLADFIYGGVLDAYACLEQETARQALAAAGDSASDLPRDRLIRGSTFVDHHGDLAKLFQMLATVRRSRNEAVHALDTRKFESLKAALAVAEAALRDG